MSEHRFYGDLAEWWPLVSPPEDYAEEAAEYARLLRAHARPVVEVLELGSGGGHNAVHLREHFTLTLVDLSPSMIEQSRRLNPGCEHHVGDMRTVRLDRYFDAVFIHDAVDYLTTEDDLAAAFATAAAHCRPGGMVLCAPDQTAEDFTPDSDHGGTDGPDGRGIRYLEWSWDPDPTDTEFCTVYAFVIRHADGGVESVHETHQLGLFPRDVWLRLLDEAGFRARMVEERTTDDRPSRMLFIGERQG